MTESLVITAIGEDHPGLVNDLTEILLAAKLNIEDSRMSILGGEFAIILQVTGDHGALTSIQQQQTDIEQKLKLNLLIKSTRQSTNTGHNRYAIHVVGMDNPGIVHRLAQFLSAQGINIITMHTSSGHAPHTGTAMYTVNIQIDMPTEADVESIKTAFNDVCNELNMDAEFQQA